MVKITCETHHTAGEQMVILPHAASSNQISKLWCHWNIQYGFHWKFFFPCLVFYKVTAIYKFVSEASVTKSLFCLFLSCFPMTDSLTCVSQCFSEEKSQMKKKTKEDKIKNKRELQIPQHQALWALEQTLQLNPGYKLSKGEIHYCTS